MTLGNRNYDSVSLSGNNNTVSRGKGNDSVTVSGSNNTVALGNATTASP